MKKSYANAFLANSRELTVSTVAEAQALQFPSDGGDWWVKIEERGGARFKYESSGVPDEVDILAVTSGGVLINETDTDFIFQTKDTAKNLFSSRLVDQYEWAKSQCAIQRAYIAKHPIEQASEPDDYLFSCGVQMNNGEYAGEIAFINDVDGFARLYFGFTGRVRPSDTLVNATNLSAVPITAGDNAYYLASTQTGETFDVVFTGIGFIFQYFVDDRGGQWSVSVDGGPAQTISTHVDSPDNANVVGTLGQFTVANDLDDAAHTATFTFLGADPNFPPSSGDARGWFRFDDGSAPTSTTAIVITGEEMRLGNTRDLVMTNILEFAINCSPSGSGLAADWVPSHSQVPGAIVVNSQEFFIDGLKKTVDQIADAEREIQEVLIRQDYTAYNTNDGAQSLPMWEGRFIHKFTKDGLHTEHEFTTLRDIDFNAGYSTSVTGRRTEGLELLVYDNGETLDISGPTPASNQSISPGKFQSVSYRGPLNGIGFRASAEASSHLIGQFSDEPSLTTERTDGFVKTYFQFTDSANGDAIPAGTTFTMSSDTFLLSGVNTNR